MQIFPQSTRVLLEPIPEEQGAIITPEGVFKDEDGNDREPLCRWRVVAKGPGRRIETSGPNAYIELEEIPVSIGDEVVIDPRFASRLEPAVWYGGKKYVLIEYGAILAKVERAPGEKVTQFTPPPVIQTAKLRVG